MENKNWKAQLVQKPGMFGFDLYIFYQAPNGKIGYVHGDIIKEIERGESVDIPPTLHIEGEEMARAILEVFSDKGIKLDKGHTEGKLEATEKHLEDMRRLVFEEPRIINEERRV